MDFTSHADNLRDDSQYLYSQPNSAHWSKSVTDFLCAKTGLKEMKTHSTDKLVT